MKTLPHHSQNLKLNLFRGLLSVFLTLFMRVLTGCDMTETSAFSQEIPLTVRIAESQIGKGEIGGNNQGPIVEMYTRGQDVAWCSAFVSWVRFQSGQRSNYFLSAKSYWKSYYSQRVTSPRPGDLIIFSRSHSQGHIGFVEKVQGCTVTTIEGNVGKYPAKVKRFHYRLGCINHLLGFVRI